jgi:CMP-N-acetylneuraminic acid synthetase
MIAITCARMGSRRLPGKCLIDVNGKPLLQYTIDFAASLGIKLYVWTRDKEILEFAGPQCPVIYEPAELYDTEYNSTQEKIEYARRVTGENIIILWQPTCPIRDRARTAFWISEFMAGDFSLGHSVFNGDENGNFYIYRGNGNGYAQEFEDVQEYDIDTQKDLDEVRECLKRL